MQPGWARCRTRNVKELRTMRFMMLVIPKGYEKAGADFTPPADLVAKMTKYNESLTKAGVLLGLDGLTPQPRAPASASAAARPRGPTAPSTRPRRCAGANGRTRGKSGPKPTRGPSQAPS